jgi:hypothetical protein
MDAAFGEVDPKLRRYLPPNVMQVPPGEYRSSEVPGRPAVDTYVNDEHGGNDKAPPYGAPEDLDDPRFQARATTGWGTASFAADPDEFLGEVTDDDHDWRSASDGYLD